jgi:hypothetical protein
MTTKTGKLPIWWPAKEQWEQMMGGCGVGARESSRLKDYANQKRSRLFWHRLESVSKVMKHERSDAQGA